ncbi:MAG TPA: serine O-acetyltransferase [Minicystis sp.]|nr:serine O-acetyltransferase [Minicystis sp.]
MASLIAKHENGGARASSHPPDGTQNGAAGSMTPGCEAELPGLVDALLTSYRSDARGHHINRRFLPSRDEIIECVGLLLQLFYPGYFGRQDLTDENVGYHVGNVLSTLREKLVRQIEMSICYRRECEEENPPPCGGVARRIAVEFLRRLPELRAQLLGDVQAAFDGDPAAVNLDEVILAYPGLLAITVYRVAHELHVLGVPLMPRIMTEWAHAHTGADIHPGANIGPSFFIDHATGVVVGETTDIGANVKLYQGVTLGALSVPRDGDGRAIRGTKRHPTVEDGVTVYANATVLGGSTVLGDGSVIGGSVFITKSIPAGSRVAVKPPELKVKPAPADHDGGPISEQVSDALLHASSREL